MATVFVIFGGFAGLILALVALVMGCGPLVAFGLWSSTGLLCAALIVIASLRPVPPLPEAHLA